MDNKGLTCQRDYDKGREDERKEVIRKLDKIRKH
jgi:hypothetical protein